MSNTIKYDELSVDHEAVKAGHAMVDLYEQHSTIYPAISEIKKQYPNLSNDVIIALWIGMNAYCCPVSSD
ncbi:hypothetical protein N473_07115 [Pseudoalteromonas luteoviolacea CPMOR-1]|uniref:Uncharacterized protein n=1 Tax=Pseudoalteromonas luteoviolacea CPMOR-1 TaxID=1365248 RepID=A0A162ASL1_9GAMM|nr:hypothetical protein [Pseudoalteromonas luteoviolacea]KZN57639.1 hypothetical protein N473_07115 [Pseudoalteromonas luteoviolacea CPMOR-1]